MMRELAALGAGTWTVAVCVLALCLAILLGGCAPSQELVRAQAELAAAEERLDAMKAAPSSYTLEEWTAAVSAWQSAQAELVEAGKADADRTLTGLPSTIEVLLGLAGLWVARDRTRKRQLATLAPAHPSES